MRASVDPPAPQVMSTQSGLRRDILSIHSYRFSTPVSVHGGKYSKEYKTLGRESSESEISSKSLIF